MTPIEAHTVYALAWLSFGAGHSLLAGARAREYLALGPYYRVAYNAFATLHIAAVWLAGKWLLGDAYRDYRGRVPAVIPWRGKVL